MRNNPTNWIKTVGPGEPFSVYVEFDPMAHGPDKVGPIRRSVYLISSAPVDGITTFPLRNLPNVSAAKMTLSGEVLSEEAYKQTQTQRRGGIENLGGNRFGFGAAGI